MNILQLTAGQGPAECQKALVHAQKRLLKEASDMGVAVELLEAVPSMSGYKSITLSLTGEQETDLAQRWSGSMVWVCPLRPGSSRKNWFFSGSSWLPPPSMDMSGIHIEVCRSSGAGGQHVNTTNSAVRATHQATGISVKIQSERSQHANKKTALALLGWRLAERAAQQASQQKSARRMSHHRLARGNPVRTFEGEAFLERSPPPRHASRQP